uniref:ALK and LTK ligand 1 n=1 Tax=Naja naja TaxID=35670 RepID=A0A8C6YE92_NAJNA
MVKEIVLISPYVRQQFKIALKFIFKNPILTLPWFLCGITIASKVFPRDSSLKDKFIKHFTGPVTFSAECSKHFHRLYHNTRDCSTPAYYKRCARLLTRLAMSPLCTQS